jgi:hypothetical protein
VDLEAVEHRDESNVDVSVWANGNAVVPSARMPLGSSFGSADEAPATLARAARRRAKT